MGIGQLLAGSFKSLSRLVKRKPVATSATSTTPIGPFKSKLYKDCDPLAIEMATGAHGEWVKRVKNLPQSMAEVKAGFLAVEEKLASQTDPLPCIVHISYKTPKATCEDDIEVHVDDDAIKAWGYERWPDCSFWKNETTISIAAVDNRNLELNPYAYQRHFFSKKFTERQAKQFAYAIDIHEGIHLNQQKMPGLREYNVYFNSADKLAWENFSQWVNCLDTDNPDYMTEQQYLNKLFEGREQPYVIERSQDYLKKILAETLKETQALEQELSFLPHQNSDRYGENWVQLRTKSQIDLLLNIHDATLAKYKELRFD